MSKRFGVGAIEIRNDLPGVELVDGTPGKVVSDAAKANGLVVLSINALQRFEQLNAVREAEARDVIRYAIDSGTQAPSARTTSAASLASRAERASSR